MSISRLMQMGAAGAPKGEPWLADLANASYDSVSFNVLPQTTDGRGLFFKPDGTKMYLVSLGADVFEYDLSTAWDLSTASYNQALDIPSPADAYGVQGMFIDPTGEILFISTGTTDTIYEYGLSTPWDISTATYSSVSLSVTSQDTSPHNIFFKPDGTKMYMVGTSSDAVHQYDLSSAWDISTASFIGSFSVASQETAPRSIFFSPNGDYMYMLGTIADAVFEYPLSTAWDLSTASYDSVSFSIAAQNPAFLGLYFKTDGSKMYAAGVAPDYVYQYTTA